MELPPADRELEADALEREVEVIARKADSGWGVDGYPRVWKREAYWKLAFALRDGGFPERAPAFREKALEFTEGVCVCIPRSLFLGVPFLFSLCSHPSCLSFSFLCGAQIPPGERGSCALPPRTTSSWPRTF